MAECHVRFIYNRNVFDHFGCRFAFWTQKVFISDRFYKVFSTWRNAMCVLSINVMPFDHFGSLFAFWTQKVFIFDRFYKGFRNAFLAFEKPRFPLVL